MIHPKSSARYFGAAVAAAITAILLSTQHYWTKPVFSPQAMSEIAKEAISTTASHPDANQTMNAVITALNRDFGSHVMNDAPWVFNNAGGAMGAMKVSRQAARFCQLRTYFL